MQRFTIYLIAICLPLVLDGCSEKPSAQPEEATTPAAKMPSGISEDDATDSDAKEAPNEEAQDVTPPPDTTPMTNPAAETEPAPDTLPTDVIGVATPKAEWSELFNNVFQSGDTYFAGLPTEEGMRQAAASGALVVVNLLTEEQQQRIDFDQPALLAELDVAFVQIPIMPNTFSAADVDHFATIMEQHQGKVLVHCASSNRVGGIWAAYLYLHQEMELETAINVGKTAGLRPGGMEDAVRRVAESR